MSTQLKSLPNMKSLTKNEKSTQKKSTHMKGPLKIKMKIQPEKEVYANLKRKFPINMTKSCEK